MTGSGPRTDETTTRSVHASPPAIARTIRNSDSPIISFGVAALCVILVGINLRPGIVSMGPLLPAIRDEFGFNNATASLLIAIPDLLMGALALPTPWLARRFGRDRLLIAALLLLLVATATRAFVTSTPLLFLTTAGVGAGIAVAGALIAGFVKASFPTRAALMISLYATAMALGSTVSAAASAPIAHFGGSWRVAAGVWSVLGIFAVAAWLLVERRGRRAGMEQIPGKRHPLPLRDSKAWLIALFFGCVNFLFYALLSWTAPIYLEQGLSATKAGLVLATFIGGSMVSTPVFGAFSRNEDRRPLLAFSAALVVAGLLCIASLPTVSAFVPALLIGFGIAGGFTLGMTLPLDNTRDANEAASWTAFVLTVGYIIAAAGPITIGALRDLTGSFWEGIWLMGCVGTVMLVLTPFLGPRTSIRPPDQADCGGPADRGPTPI